MGWDQCNEKRTNGSRLNRLKYMIFNNDHLILVADGKGISKTAYLPLLFMGKINLRERGEERKIFYQHVKDSVYKLTYSFQELA